MVDWASASRSEGGGTMGGTDARAATSHDHVERGGTGGLGGAAAAASAPQQLVRRARIVLAAAAGCNNAQIVRECAVDIGTARRWRGRGLGLQAVSLAELSVEERLTDAPRSGKPAGISAAQQCQIVALACAAPATAGRPISQWTGREVADEIVARGILPAISPRHAARLLTRGMCAPLSSATG